MLIATWLFIALFVLVFTAWGWRLVLIPVGRVLIPLLWKTLMFLVWTGFAGAVLMMPVTYRTFGWDLTDVLLAPVPELREKHRREREENYEPVRGCTSPGGGRSEGLPRLPDDWDGEGQHALPAWSLIPAAIGILVFRRASKASVKGGAMGVTSRVAHESVDPGAHREHKSMPPQIMTLGATIETWKS